MSLRSKLIGGFGLLLMLIVVLGWVTLSLFTSLRGVQKSVFNKAVPRLQAVDEIVRSYTAQSAAVRGFLIGGDPLLVRQYHQEVKNSRRWEKHAQQYFSGPDEALLKRLEQAGHSFQAVVDGQVIPLATRGLRTEAFRILSQQSGRIAKVERLGVTLRRHQADLMFRTEQDLANHSNQAIVLLVAVIAAAILLGALVAFMLPRRLSRDLFRLVDAARAVGRGDLDHRVEIRSGDEVQELAERFGEMQSGLKRLQQLALQDRELEIAASIQRNLLQRSVPQPPGVKVVPLQRQANLVGGDWYDVELTGRQVAVAVGDASGKGIGAALMATIALSFLRAERGLRAVPKRIVQRANDAICGATEPDQFTTLIYASIDVYSGEVRWLNMGHPAPFILSRPALDEPPRGYFLEGPRNRALGWFDDPGLSETVVRLRPGDRMILYTDGFLEAKSPEGEVFGEERFAAALVTPAALGAEELASRVVEEVERFAAGKLDDDLTMLVVEFVGAPSAEEAPAEQLAGRERTGEEAWHSRK